jgi:predicted lipoprotein with Yx(FWY)xxD motif
MAVYSYVKDAAPTTSFGDGLGESWFVAGQDMAMPPEMAIGRTFLGRVLIDAHDMTLYYTDGDKVKPRQVANAAAKSVGLFDLSSACAKACLKTWKPLAAPAVAMPKGDWSVVVREDGSRQWAYQGKALYSYAGDLAPSEYRGEGVDRTWHTAVVEPTPPIPSWITFEASDAGELLANEKHFTIYAFNEAANKARRSNLGAPATCDDDCIKEWWTPIYATEADKPVGNWWIVKTPEGKLQWAYKGEVLYTHVRDKKPGDITGTRFTGSKAWHPLMRSGNKMQGQGGN